MGVGTMWITEADLGPPSGSAVSFRMSLVANLSSPYSGSAELVVPFDTIDFDTNSACNLSYAGPGPDYGGHSYPTFIVPVTGTYCLQTQTWFNDSSTETNQIYQALTHLTSTGDEVAFYGTRTGDIAPIDPATSEQFSAALSIITQCTAGDLIFANSDSEKNTRATLSIIGTDTGPPFVTTYFAGFKVG